RRVRRRRDRRLLQDLHARRLRGGDVPRAAVPADGASPGARLPVSLLDVRSRRRRQGPLRAGRPTAADAADPRRRGRAPPRQGQLRRAGRPLVVGRPDLEAEPVIWGAVRFLDRRSASAPLLRKTLRYLFPDHWSFLLGEVALYSFVTLVATGIYLTFFFVDSTKEVVYHGPYPPLYGQQVSEAY